jgi:uncharacterized membrane protein
LLCGVVGLIATVLALAGAWLILPFAGLEVALLVWAFRQIALRDQDFEQVRVDDGLWTYEARKGGRSLTGSGALAWLQVDEDRIAGRLVVGLRYAGRRFEVGSYLPEDQRAGLARELAGVIRGGR